MNSEAIVFISLGAFAGGFINGLAGTGTALFALGFYLVVLDPVSAVAVVAAVSVLTGIQGLWVVRRAVMARPRRFLQFLIPGVFGVPLGILVLDVLDASVLRLTIAALLIIYGGYFGFRAALPAFSRQTPVIDSCIGFIAGVLGGAASLAGAIPTLWLSLRPWPKAETRAVLQPFNLTILALTVCLLFFRGAYDATTVRALILTIPIGVIAAQIGIWVFHRLSDNAFRRLLIVMTLVLGLGVLASEVF